jgi:dTMP kinase
VTGAARPGRFIVFEGADGAGKTTQLRRLALALRQEGREVVETREPGGSPGAEAIRRLLVEGEPGRWSAETELLLFTAARRDHVERALRPALARGAAVLCDRFVDSTRAYQAAGRGAARADVEALHERFIGLEPDVVLILDLDPEAARARGLARLDGEGGAEARFERFGGPFQRALRDAFRALAAEDPARRRLVDASGDAGAVAARIRAACAPVLDAASG